MLRRFSHLLIAGLFVSSLAACGGGGGGGGDANLPTGVNTPPAQTYAVTGIVAAGMALPEAQIETYDADGNPIDAGRTATDASGRYRVSLPGSTRTPILIRTVNPDGDEMAALVMMLNQAETIAHINPVTDLVVRQLLDTPPATSSIEVFAARAADLDPAVFTTLGDELMQRLFGLSVTFRDFASHPDFIAGTATSGGSGADTLLEVLQLAARRVGLSRAAYLQAAAEDDAFQPLLSRLESLTQLIALRSAAGVAAVDLESDLRSYGAWSEDGTSAESQLLELLSLRLPPLIDALQVALANGVEAAAESTTAPATDLTQIGIRILVESLSRSLAIRIQSYDATLDGLDLLLADPDFHDALAGAVPLVSNWLAAVQSASADDGLWLRIGIDSMAPAFSGETALTLAALDYLQTDVEFANLTSAYLENRFGGVDSNALLSIGYGEPAGNIVEAVDSLPSALDLLTVFVNDHPQIADGNVVLYPTGRWGRDTWGHFKWG